MTDVFRAELRAHGFDPRRTLARPDVADIALKGQIASEDFQKPETRRVTRGKVALLRSPHDDAPRETELLFGEPVKHLATFDGFAFVQSEVDRYTGYVPARALGERREATHRVAVPSTFLYPEANIKTGPLAVLSLGSRLAARPSESAKFLETPDGFVFAAHVKALDDFEPDFVSVAEQFLFTPYLWGGRTAEGLDCSALVQVSLLASGKPCSRDTDMQWAELGTLLCEGVPEVPLKRGDLIFWDGHIGIMQNETMLIHANGHHMQTRSEPLEEAVKRIASLYGPVKGARRL